LRGWRDLRAFIRLPHAIYRDDPYWVPPLHREIRKLLSRRRNPFYEHGEACFWLARRGNRVVGRIGAQINRLHLDTYRDATGNFGFIEAVDDQAVFHALLTTAEAWLRERGMRRVLGPYSPSIHDEIGVLISGFASAPMILMGHSRPYYSQRIESEGYRKAKDVYALSLDTESIDRDYLDRVMLATAKLRSESRLAVRTPDIDRFDEEIRLALDVCNDAWDDNWGYLPVTEREANALIAEIKPIFHPRSVVFGMLDGKAAGIVISMPNINEIFADLRGALVPFGWAKLLWRLRRHPPKSARIFAVGVRRAYRHSALSGALVMLMLAELEKYYTEIGIEKIEISWVLEDNRASMAVERAGAKVGKIYRIYGKELAS